MHSHQTIVALPNVAEAVARMATNKRGQERGHCGQIGGQIGGHPPLATNETPVATNDMWPSRLDKSETAVTRWLQMGKRPIPDGPGVRAFVDHRLWLIQLDPESAVLTRTEAYDEYADMCALGGWRPLGRNQFVRALERLGYYPVRQQTSGDRARLLDFSQAPVVTLAAKAEP